MRKNIFVTNNLVNNLVVNLLSVVGSLLLVNLVWSSDSCVNVMPWFLGSKSSQICDDIYEQSCDDTILLCHIFTLHKWFLASTWHFLILSRNNIVSNLCCTNLWKKHSCHRISIWYCSAGSGKKFVRKKVRIAEKV